MFVVFCFEGFFSNLLSLATKECIRSWVQGSFRATYLLSRILDGDEIEWAELRKKIRSSLTTVAKQLARSPDTPTCPAHFTGRSSPLVCRRSL